MRIVLVSNWFPPVISGSSYYAGTLAQRLAARGHDLAVVTIDWGEADGEAAPFPIHRLRATRMPPLGVFYGMDRMAFACTPANYRRVRDIVRDHRAQVVHHVNHIFDTALLSLAAARATGVPIVGSITTPIQHQHRLIHALMAFADRWTVGQIVQRWDAAICLDETMCRYVRDLYGRPSGDRIVMIPYGVPPDTASAEPASPPEGPRQVLLVGHLHPFRNPVQLVRAMPLIRRALPGTRLVIAGRPTLDEPVREARALGLEGDGVRFLGEVPHAEVVRLLRESHAFATWVTGPYHGIGTAALEAMQLGLPVVTDVPADVFGPGQLVDGENVVIADSRDPQAIARALIALLSDEPRRLRLGAAGRRWVREFLDWDRIAGEVERLYHRILA